MKKMLFALMAFFLLAFMAFAQDLPAQIPDGDPMTTLIFLIQNFKVIGPVASGMLIVTFTVQALKSEKFSGIFKKLSGKAQVAIITILGLIYGAAYTLAYKKQPLDFWIIGLISSGGAVSLFNLIKMLFEKKSE